MTRIPLLLALAALAAAATLAARPLDVPLDGFSDDADAWLDQLAERND